jgi:hypothetical protein
VRSAGCAACMRAHTCTAPCMTAFKLSNKPIIDIRIAACWVGDAAHVFILVTTHLHSTSACSGSYLGVAMCGCQPRCSKSRALSRRACKHGRLAVIDVECSIEQSARSYEQQHCSCKAGIAGQERQRTERGSILCKCYPQGPKI